MSRPVHNINPERESLYDDTAQLLARGYTLIGADIAYMLPYYGYSAESVKTYAYEFMNSEATEQALAARSVNLVIDPHKRKNIYRDDNVAIDETDVEESKKRIDALFKPKSADHLSTTQIEQAAKDQAALHLARCRSSARLVMQHVSAQDV